MKGTKSKVRPDEQGFLDAAGHVQAFLHRMVLHEDGPSSLSLVPLQRACLAISTHHAEVLARQEQEGVVQELKRGLQEACARCGAPEELHDLLDVIEAFDGKEALDGRKRARGPAPGGWTR